MKFDGTSCMTAPIWDEARMQSTSGNTMMAWVSASDELTCPIQDTQGLTIMGRGWDYSMGVTCHAPTPASAVTGGLRLAGAQTWGYAAGAGYAYPNAWVHVAITWDMAAGTPLIYYNGKVAGSYPMPQGDFGDVNPTFAIGCQISWLWSGDQRIRHFSGTIDEAMLYNRVLSPEEIGSYYSAADPCDHAELPDGSACTDINICTQTDTCSSGECIGTNPVVCTAQDSCHEAGTCHRSNGCSNPAKPDGVACNDGNTCTQTETCQAGVCDAPDNQPTILELAVEDLGNLGGASVSVLDINRRGDMVGRATIPSGESHAFLRPSDGPVTDIDTNRPGEATGINDTGWVAGSFNVSNAWRAFRRDPFNGGIQDLGFVSDGSASTNPSFALRGSIGREINNAGQVVGYFTTGGAVHAFRYTDEGEDGIYEDIGTLAGGLTLASGIDDTGTVVGGSWVPGSPETTVRLLGHGVMFRNEAEGLIDLNSINPASGWTLRHAFDIAGDFIVGTGELNGKVVTYRLQLSTGEIEEVSGGWQGHTYGNGVNRFGETSWAGVSWTPSTRSLPPSSTAIASDSRSSATSLTPRVVGVFRSPRPSTSSEKSSAREFMTASHARFASAPRLKPSRVERPRRAVDRRDRSASGPTASRISGTATTWRSSAT